LNGLGWNLNENFGELLDETVKWDLDNPDWWPDEFIRPYLSRCSLGHEPKNGKIEKSSSQIELEVATR
jgi:hypothetical protein